MPRKRSRLWSSLTKLVSPKLVSPRRISKMAGLWVKLANPLSKALRAPAAVPAPAPLPAPAGGMVRKYLVWQGSRGGYLLFVPPHASGDALPLLLMLHGCHQGAADFAKGTRMNEVAARHGFAVAYPEQTSAANRMRCWNWFDRRSQGRQGESAMLAALAQDAARKAGADVSRIHVAGLSAGGAMALVTASAHPEVFAAAGCHSAVPEGAASEVFGALRVMKHGPSKNMLALASGGATTSVPVIVFHGTADKTVHPDNASAIVAAARRGAEASGTSTLGEVDTMAPPAGGRHAAQVVKFVDAQGHSQIESWTVAGLGHAWSGGSREGSFTDPLGPDASEAMVAFFLPKRVLHRR